MNQEAKELGMPGLPAAPIKPILPITLAQHWRMGSLAEKRGIAEKISEFVISNAPESQNTIVILQLLRN